MSFHPLLPSKYQITPMEPDLQPTQVKTDLQFLKATNGYVRKFIKHPKLSYFHSYPEFLHAALLEADATVTSFVPQPFRLRVNSKRYVPDCFVVRGSQRLVVELKKDGEMDSSKVLSLENFFATRNMIFQVIGNDEILMQETTALSWLKIVQSMVIHADIDTSRTEEDVLQLIGIRSEVVLSELLESTRPPFSARLLSVQRLLHRGVLSADLSEHSLYAGTVIKPCG
ncbi:MAG: hypothetical protein ACI9UU_000318 [Candidatus Azotimanducaceae bacterium]